MKKQFRSKSAIAFATAAALAATAIITAAGCQDSLAIKDKVVADVEKATAPKNPGMHVSVLGGEIHSADTVTFPATILSQTSASVRITIENVGDRALTLKDSPIVKIQGPNPSAFTPVSQPAGTVGPNSSTYFDVTFSPGAVGSYTAFINISSDDPTYSTFQINLAGNGTEWHGLKAVETTGDVGLYSSLGVNGSNVYIAFFDSSNTRLNVIRTSNGGQTWATKIVPDSTQAGTDISMAVYNGDLYISYSTAVPLSIPSLRFIKATGGTSWGSYQTLDSAGSSSCIAVDGGTIWIGYIGGSTYHIQRSTNGTSWTADYQYSGSGFSPGGAVSHAAISVLNNSAFIAYRNSSTLSCDNYYYYNDPYEWVSGTADSTANTGQYVSIAPISTMNSFLAYYADSVGDLKFVKTNHTLTSLGFTGRTTVDSSGNVGQYTSIATPDFGNTVYISYYDATNGDLKFAKSEYWGDSWTTRTVDSVGNVGQYTSIKVVPGSTRDTDVVYISYYDVTNKDLKIAKSLDGGATW